MDRSSRPMVPKSLCKVETLVGGIPPGTFSFQDPHRVIIEDAGMDFLNHPRFKCGQNVQRDVPHLVISLPQQVDTLL